MWRYKPGGESEACDVSVWYVYATTAMVSNEQVAGWKQKAVKNASFITRRGCLRLGLEVYDGDNPYSGNCTFLQALLGAKGPVCGGCRWELWL